MVDAFFTDRYQIAQQNNILKPVLVRKCLLKHKFTVLIQDKPIVKNLYKYILKQ